MFAPIVKQLMSACAVHPCENAVQVAPIDN
jgi:hypothetical protein